MKRTVIRGIGLFSMVATTAGIVLSPSSSEAQGVSPSMMRACHDYVWQRPKFRNIPNAGISIQSGDYRRDGTARVHWLVDWEGRHSRGICVVNRNNRVINFQEQSSQTDWPHGSGPGIYYDTRSRRWKTADGQVCYTCTPENGFAVPRVDGPFYYDPKIRKWRDSTHQGAICHTCTPENGFGHAGGGGGGWGSGGSSGGGWGDDSGRGYGVTLFRDVKFGGVSETFSNDVADLRRGSRVGNDQATSVSISRGCRARLYRDLNFRGAYTDVTSDIFDLRGSLVGNDAVTSLRVRCDGGGWENDWGQGSGGDWGSDSGRYGVTLFRDLHYGGVSETFTDDVPDLRRGSSVGNDQATSVSVSRGCRARLYRDLNYGGAFTEVSSDIPDLRGSRVGNDAVTSLQVRCNR